MPREIVDIKIDRDGPFWEPGAKFLAYLAFPDNLDATVRTQFRIALSLWCIKRNMAVDPAWALKSQLIPPEYFRVGERVASKAFERGLTQLQNRYLAANYVFEPHVDAVLGMPLHKPEGLAATVENMLLAAIENKGWKVGSLSTAKTTIWKPSKPVLHAVSALLCFGRMFERGIKDPNFLSTLGENELKEVQVEKAITTKDLPLGQYINMNAEMLLWRPGMVAWVISLSEIIRLQMTPKITQFEISESDQIQFQTNVRVVDFVEPVTTPQT